MVAAELCTQSSSRDNDENGSPNTRRGVVIRGPGSVSGSAATRKQVRDLLEKSPELFWAASQRASHMYREERYEEALTSFNRAVQLVQDHPDLATQANKATLYYNVGRTLSKLSRHLECIGFCERALNERPAYSSALAQRASSYSLLFDYDRALVDYEALLTILGESAPGSHHHQPAEADAEGASPSFSEDDWLPYVEQARQRAARAKDHYHVLNVPADATLGDIKKSYRKLCLRWHPDKHRGSADREAQAANMFRRLNEAYETLTDEHRRTLFDIDRIARGVASFATSEEEDGLGPNVQPRGGAQTFRARRRRLRRLQRRLQAIGAQRWLQTTTMAASLLRMARRVDGKTLTWT